MIIMICSSVLFGLLSFTGIIIAQIILQVNREKQKNIRNWK
nr:MAG TPA: hypothetical protein [Caudoviricetes sp.]